MATEQRRTSTRASHYADAGSEHLRRLRDGQYGSAVDFYSAAAQIIPVLYLAMAFESRVLYRTPSSYTGDDDPRSWNGSQIVLVAAVTLLMTIGEIAALGAVASQEASSLVDSLVWSGLTAGVLGVVVPVLHFQWSLWRRFRAAGGGAFVPLFVAVGLAAVFVSYVQAFS